MPAGHPSLIPPTVAEREAELAALQQAFDEYITSSRELEDELDAELAKMQEKLAESSSANATLSAQLENVAPQLSSMERAIAATKARLEKESTLRRKAELAQDEAEAQARELEGSLDAVRSECDEAHEQLAFRDEEVEELKAELEIDRERHRVEMDEITQKLEDLEKRLWDAEEDREEHATPNGKNKSPTRGSLKKLRDSSLSGDIARNPLSNIVVPIAGKDSDEYVKRLEDELEDVTEQLIEAETRISEVESQLATTENARKASEKNAIEIEARLEETMKLTDRRRVEGEMLEEKKQRDYIDKEDKNSGLKNNQREQTAELSRELALLHEELTLTQEELRAAEDDTRASVKTIEQLKLENKELLSKFQAEHDQAKSDARSAKFEVEGLVKALQDATVETEGLRDQANSLVKALRNAEMDHANVLAETKVLRTAFDKAEIERHEIYRQREEELKQELMNAHLQEVKDLEHKLCVSQAANNASAEKFGHSPAKNKYSISSKQDSGDKQLSEATARQVDLVQAMGERVQQTKETNRIRSDLEFRLQQTEAKLLLAKSDLEKTRKELDITRTKLAEAELRQKRIQENNGLSMTQSSPSRRASLRQSISRRQSSKELLMATPENDARLEQRDDEATSVFYRSHARSRSRPLHTCSTRGRSSSPTTIQRLEIEVKDKARKVLELSDHCTTLKDQNRMSDISVKNLEHDVRKLHMNLMRLGGEIPDGLPPLKSTLQLQDGADAVEEIDTDESILEEIINQGSKERIVSEVRTLLKKSSSLKVHNAHLLVRILKLQGNIQVCCRIRPIKAYESQRGLRRVVEPLSETEVGCFDSRTKAWKSYGFDKVWGPDVTQKEVFQDVEPLALSVADGYNACIFAYGQTGSGKTYTMDGCREGNQYGISYRTIQKIFTLLNFRAHQQTAATSAIHSPHTILDDNRDSAVHDELAERRLFSVPFTFSIVVGMLEIYNDEVYDLLAPLPKYANRSPSKKSSLDIRRGEGGCVEVVGLMKESVDTLQDVMKLLQKGNENRATASTNLNEYSSRSHMVLLVEVTSGTEGQPANKGSLFLVDLAGSERVRKSEVSGKELKEAGYINKSLAALGNVMEALDRKSSHIPFRDSKLTYLLQDCFGGNSRTMMVVTACPASDSYDETQCALQFATRVRRIHLGSAQKNVTSKNLEETVKNLTVEIKLLAKAKERSEEQLLSLKRDHARIHERLQQSSESRVKNQDENRALVALKKNNVDMTARWQKQKVILDQANSELENCQQELKRVQGQLLKVQKDRDFLTKKLVESEEHHSETIKELRVAKDASSAANLRARKAQVLQFRQGSAPAIQTARSKSGSDKSEVDMVKDSKSLLKSLPSSSVDEISPDEVRKKVLYMLQIHDPNKVDKIDAIMDRFKGREAFLLDKMVARYECDNNSDEDSGEGRQSSSSAAAAHSRSQMALARHKERMLNRRSTVATAGGSSSKPLQPL